MAEAIELPFPPGDVVRRDIDQLVEKTVRHLQSETSVPPQEEVPHQYRIDNYYAQDTLGSDVLKNKYLAPDEKHPYELWVRQAKALAKVEQTTQFQQEWEAKFFSILEDFRFTPGGRIMHGAGRQDITTTLNNCYVVAIQEDSIQAIYTTIQEEALTYKFGGGCGHDLSILRPAGEVINGTGGSSCGPVGFMNLFSENTNTIAQHGRRGANMQTLRVDHPDIEKFVNSKSGDINMVKFSNISVLLTREFMEAVEKDADFDLRWGDKVYKTIRARELWDTIIAQAHASAEPGLIFWDTMKEHHNAEYCSPLISTNPCAEQPLPDGGCCNLGSINLERYVDANGNFMIEEFKTGVACACRFLDNVIDYNLERHALKAQKTNALDDRRVGLGILGLGDMLVKMGIKYDSEDAFQTVDQIMQLFRDTAYETSIELARDKGPFPNFNWEGYSKSKFVKNLPKSIRQKIQQYGIRNATILTVPPTGSGAIVARVTSGIEPIFATSYNRRVKVNNGFGQDFKEYKVYHPIIEKLFVSDANLPDYVVTAHEIDPYFRVKMQGVIQKYIDSSISSTVNLPEDVTVDTVSDIYMTAFKTGLKGITVYREGSREGILLTQRQTEKNDGAPQKVAPREMKKIPRVRPLTTQGITRRVRTGEGTLYITINEDEHGLCEVFTTIGKAGGHAAAQSEAISRLISLALRSGVEPQQVVRQLKGISGPDPRWEDGRLILSTPDAIGKALNDYLKEGRAESNPAPPKGTQFTLADQGETSDPDQGVCLQGSPTTCTNVISENGCLVCKQCGWSKCD